MALFQWMQACDLSLPPCILLPIAAALAYCIITVAIHLADLLRLCAGLTILCNGLTILLLIGIKAIQTQPNSTIQ